MAAAIKRENALEDVALVAGTQQNLSNLYSLDIYGPVQYLLVLAKQEPNWSQKILFSSISFANKLIMNGSSQNTDEKLSRRLGIAAVAQLIKHLRAGWKFEAGNTKGGSITVPLTSSLTGLD